MPSKQVPIERIPSGSIPQADQPKLVVDVLSFISLNGRRPREGEGEFTNKKRQLDYACQAAALLGFLEKDDHLTETGRILLSLEQDLRLLRLIFAFEGSEVGRAWLRWQGTKELDEVDPNSAEDFLRACAENADTTTAERRASTLRSWAQKFQDLRNREAGPTLSFGDFSGLERPAHDALAELNIFEAGATDRVLQRLGPGTHQLRVASGFFTISGFLRLVQPLRRAVVKLLIGQEDRNPFARRSERDAVTILALFRASLGQGLLDFTRRKEMRKLHELILRSLVKIRHFEPRKTKGLHAKVYIFDKRAVYVTSSNLTIRGLQQNVEAGRVLGGEDQRPDVEHFYERFNALFKDAIPLSAEILRALEDSWAFKEPVSPYQFFLKVMFELYDRLPPLDGEMKKPLADFQRRIVTPVISKLLSYRGAMLIAPVGSGKTLMASYIAAYLYQERHIRRVVVICPNDSIAKKWRDEMNLFDLEFTPINHGVLRREEADLSEENRQLLRHLRVPRGDRLFIVDECHHFRNEDTEGWKSLSRLITPEDATDETRPYCLILTATPFSIGLTNLNALLGLVAQPPIESIIEINERYAVVNVTLPFILTYYGVEQPGKPGRALRFGETYRYYPEQLLHTETYQSAMEAALLGIERLPMEFTDGGKAAAEAIGADDEAEGRPRSAKSAWYGAMLRKNLARRAESSPPALRQSIAALRSGVKEKRIFPLDEELFLRRLDELEECLCPPERDTKLEHLVTKLRELGARRKVLIFSEAVATVEYLASQLRLAFPKDQISSLTGMTSLAERQKILEGFPETIDIFVSSNACAEGEDLPGAQLVVNYDLSWTPLTLAQRIGRIDRATDDLLQVTILNFYPGSEHFDRLVGLWDRLDERAGQLKTLTTQRVLGEHERRSAASKADDIGMVRSLYEEEDYERFLRDVLPTPRYLQAWLAAPEEEKRAAGRLHAGVQSGQTGGERGCYVLLRCEDLLFSVYRDRDSGALRCAPKEVGHEFLVNEYVYAERDTPLLSPPVAFDDEVAATVQEWATSAGIEPDDVTIVASKYFGQ